MFSSLLFTSPQIFGHICFSCFFQEKFATPKKKKKKNREQPKPELKGKMKQLKKKKQEKKSRDNRGKK